MTPVSSRVSNSSLTAAEPRSNRRAVDSFGGFARKIVYDGEIWVELDNSETLHLRRGDVVVQNGTRHAWRNKATKPVTILFFLNGTTA
jgi:hypothetical protein